MAEIKHEGLEVNARLRLMKNNLAEQRKNLMEEGKHSGAKKIDHIISIFGDERKAKKHFGNKLLIQIDESLGTSREYKIKGSRIKYLGDVAEAINAIHYPKEFEKTEERKKILKKLKNTEEIDLMLTRFQNKFSKGKVRTHNELIKEAEEKEEHPLRPVLRSLKLID